MKKVLFIIRDFKTGGIPRCMQSTLQLLDTSKYDVDLLCMHQLGPYNGKMPNCNVLKQDNILYHLLQFRKDYNNNPITYFYKLINSIFYKLTKKNLITIQLQKIAKRLSYKYDTVVAYSGGISSELAQFINGAKRIIWIHNDYAFEPARDDQKTDFSKFDKIVCVSESAKKSFKKIYPNFVDKTVSIYNLINDQFIRESSNENINDPFDKNFFNIISVGRICWQKNFKVIPTIIGSMPQDIRNHIRWYIIGNGSDIATSELFNEIKKYHVEKQCIPIGPKSNPYPYIKSANLYVLTSIHESFCLVIHESLALGTPVISVPIPVVAELLGNDIIHSIEDMSDAIIHYIKNESLFYIPKDYNSHNRQVLNRIESIL